MSFTNHSMSSLIAAGLIIDLVACENEGPMEAAD
jgi:hypothetical protein